MRKGSFFLECVISILSCLFCISFSAFLEATSPEIHSIIPNTGSTASSTQVTIKGADFQPTLQVSLYRGGAFITGSCTTLSIAKDVYVQGSYAYVANGERGLLVIDISNPADPFKVGSRSTSGSAWGVFLKDSYAYVVDSLTLQVIDISNPADPFKVGSRSTPGSAWDVFVQGSYAYVADGSEGLQVINVSSPSSPSKTGTRNTPDSAWDVFVQGSYAYVADGASGLQVIDISNPAKPSIKGSRNTWGSARDVFVQGSYAYVADIASGLRIIDISNPASPTIKGTCTTPGSASGVYVQGPYAYVADGTEGLQVIDVSNPAKPSIIDSCNTPGSASSVFVQGSYVYVADGNEGLQVIEMPEHLSDVIYIDSNTITVTVPAGFVLGTYSLYITNPDGEHALLHNAFTVKGIEIYLSAGLNIFGYPMTVQQGYTSYDLLTALGNEDEVSNIQRYDPNTENFETTVYDSNGVPSGKEFDIVSGEGYLVYMKTAKLISFDGAKADPAISCQEGFNIISIPSAPVGYTSYNLLSYLGLSDEIASITRFNTEMGIYETTSYYNGRPSGIEFDINYEEAYLIHMFTATQ